MPFVQGGELDTHLTQKKRMTESQAKIISFQLALVLSYLHENKLMYRDLKTENVMIDKDGYIQLIDFGLASKLNENEKSTVLCGTPDYMAPEIINQ
jgi:serine/threonine protein kinase